MFQNWLSHAYKTFRKTNESLRFRSLTRCGYGEWMVKRRPQWGYRNYIDGAGYWATLINGLWKGPKCWGGNQYSAKSKGKTTFQACFTFSLKVLAEGTATMRPGSFRPAFDDPRRKGPSSLPAMALLECHFRPDPNPIDSRIPWVRLSDQPKLITTTGYTANHVSEARYPVHLTVWHWISFLSVYKSESLHF